MRLYIQNATAAYDRYIGCDLSWIGWDLVRQSFLLLFSYFVAETMMVQSPQVGFKRAIILV